MRHSKIQLRSTLWDQRVVKPKTHDGLPFVARHRPGLRRYPRPSGPPWLLAFFQSPREAIGGAATILSGASSVVPQVCSQSEFDGSKQSLANVKATASYPPTVRQNSIQASASLWLRCDEELNPLGEPSKFLIERCVVESHVPALTSDMHLLRLRLQPMP